MEDQAQKMVALKKVYAEIILNTAKEAAARVMASERRALGYQQELASTKDKALRMLLRLKHMVDANSAEAGVTSLNQQRKIEELEAQLNEAEDVITDLRAELKQVWLELEKTKNSPVHSLAGQNINQVASFEESVRPSASSCNQELERVTNCDVKNKAPTVNVLDDKFCNPTKQTEQLCISNLEDFYDHDSDFDSIIMRGKEPELCKNGCTQRIRAFEGNLLDEKLIARDIQNQHFGIKNGLVVKDSDEKVANFSKMEAKKYVECHKTNIDEKWKSDKGGCSLTSIKPCAISRWKRKKRRCRSVRVESSVLEHSKPSFVLKQCSNNSNNGKCLQDEPDVKTKQVLHLTDAEPLHGSTGVIESVLAVNKFEHVEKDNELLNEYILGNMEGSTSKNLTVTSSSSNMNVEVVDVPSLTTDVEDTKTFEEHGGSLGQADDSRLLRYTFQRKRKKESSRNPYEKTDSEKSTVKRKVEEKQNSALEPHKSCMIDEPSSRDSRRLAQVARQLISLSAKRW